MAYRALGTDRIMEIASAPGTGNVTLGGCVTGFRPFSIVMAANDTCAYFIEAVDATGNLTGAWERGFGTFLSATSFNRTIVTDSSSGAGVAVNFTGNIRIGCGPMSDTTMGFPVPGGRLSLVSGGPVGEANNVSLVYYSPYVHDRIPLWNGAGIQVVPFGVTQLTISTYPAGTACDVFGFLQAGSFTLECLAWTNPTTRATTLAYLNGFLCKSTDATRRYLGSFYTNGAGTTSDSQNNGTAGNPVTRLVWNMYNRILRPVLMVDTTTWTYATNAWEIIRGLPAPNGSIQMMRGLDEDAVFIYSETASNIPNGAAYYYSIGLDGANIGAAQSYGSNSNGNAGNIYRSGGCPFVIQPGVGYHYLCLLENVGGGVACGQGSGSGANTTMYGQVRA